METMFTQIVQNIDLGQFYVFGLEQKSVHFRVSGKHSHFLHRMLMTGAYIRIILKINATLSFILYFHPKSNQIHSHLFFNIK